MDRKTAEALEDLLESQIGFYLRAEMLVRLLTRANVYGVLQRLPPDFRGEFLSFARDAYHPYLNRLEVAGPPIPQVNIDALRYGFDLLELAKADRSRPPRHRRRLSRARTAYASSLATRAARPSPLSNDGRKRR